MDYILQLSINAGIFILLATSLNLINGLCGQFSLGHAGFWAIGAYVSASYAAFLVPMLPSLPDFINLLIANTLGFIAAAIAGLVVGIPCLRLRGDYLAIATLGFGEIIRIIITNTDAIGGPRGFTAIPHWTNIYWTYFWVVVNLIFLANLKRSTHGRAIISIREDELAAESMGIQTTTYKTLAFVIGAGIAGLAGSLWAHAQQYIHPHGFNFLWSIIILLMVILGGLGSFSGSVIGAIILTLLPEMLRMMGEDIAKWRMVIYSMVLIILMLLRPQGIFGKNEINLKKILKRIRS